jgi:hypothetical protein
VYLIRPDQAKTLTLTSPVPLNHQAKPEPALFRLSLGLFVLWNFAYDHGLAPALAFLRLTLQ